MLNTEHKQDSPAQSELDSSQGPVLALLLSLVLHALLLGGIQLAPKSNPTTFEVEMLPQTESPKQMVAPSQSPIEKPREDIRRTSERDSKVEKESIRRAPNPAPESLDKTEKLDKPRPNQEASKPKPTEAVKKKTSKAQVKSQRPAASKADKNEVKKPQKVELSPNAKLRLSENSLRGTIPLRSNEKVEKPEDIDPAQARLDSLLATGSNPTARSSKSDAERERLLREYRPFRSRGAGSLFNPRSGSSDYLPNIPDGDLTLLNAKADRHAVFVRRVALQVFGALRRESWAELSYQSILRLKDYTTIRAVMSPNGHLLEVIFESGSGVGEFDNLVKKAAKIGAWDKNPPASARHADGNIHFVFKARSWSRPMGEARREQRWLLLSTGLL
jgi:hypothetical protein